MKEYTDIIAQAAAEVAMIEQEVSLLQIAPLGKRQTAPLTRYPSRQPSKYPVPINFD